MLCQLMVGWLYQDSTIGADQRGDAAHPPVGFDYHLLSFFVMINVYPPVRNIMLVEKPFCPAAIRTPVSSVHDYRLFRHDSD
jgi:hypothetical protein